MTHPGSILNQKLKEARMHRSELAKRTGVTEKHICTVVNGQKGITVAFAQKLGYVFEDASFWLKLQAEYDEEQLRIKEESCIAPQEIAVLEPLQEMIAHFVEHGELKSGCSDASMVMQLRRLLRVSNLTAIPEISFYADYRARLASSERADPYVLFAWQRMCEIETPLDEITAQFDNSLPYMKRHEIRAIMFSDPNDIYPELKKLFAECGIAFRMVPAFHGAPVRAFIKETSNQKLIFCMTVPHQRADTFWHTLFHELYHMIHLHLGHLFYVDFDFSQGNNDATADEFAREMLISTNRYRDFLQSTRRRVDWPDVERLAKSANVLPCIALGRLQNDGVLDWSDFSDQVVKYSWA